MKVLYITHCTDMSGANKSMFQMIKELQDNHGVQPFVIYPKIYDKSVANISEALEKRSIKGLSHRMICFERKRTNIFHKFYFVLFQFVYILHILFLIRNYKFDLVHSNSSVLDIGLFISKALRIPHVWHFREVASKSFGYKSIFGYKYQKWAYSQATKIIAISKNVKEEFANYDVEDKTEVIYNGILPPAVDHTPNHNQKPIRICIVGRIEPNKNQLEAIKAIKILRDRGGKDFKLFIIGNGSGPYFKEVHKYVEDNGLQSFVDFLGRRNDVNELLQDMNIGLMLSRHEAFGRVTVEYMMHKMCVVASNTSANIEIVRDGINGRLYEFGDPNSLATILIELLNSTYEIKIMSANAEADALKNYKSVTNSDKVFDLYNRIIPN